MRLLPLTGGRHGQRHQHLAFLVEELRRHFHGLRRRAVRLDLDEDAFGGAKPARRGGCRRRVRFERTQFERRARAIKARRCEREFAGK